MAKKKKQKSRSAHGITGGPFVQFAAICEKAIQDQGGAASLIQIIDTITVHGEGRAMEPGALQFMVAIGFKSGGFKGRKTLTIASHSPDGAKAELKSVEQDFKGAQAGTIVLANSLFAVKAPGLYWFDVQLDGVTATKIPLMVKYEQMPKPATPAQKAIVQAPEKKVK